MGALKLDEPRVWVNTLGVARAGFCLQCGIGTLHTVTLPRIRGGVVVAEWNGCEDCLAELRAEMKAKRGRR